MTPASGPDGGGGRTPLTLLPGAVAFCLALYFLLFASRAFDLAIDVGDEGVTATQAWRVARGEVPGADFFEIIPPVSLLPPALSVAVFGPTVFAQRLLTLLYAALLILLTDALVSRYAKAWGPRALVALFLVPFGVYYWPMPSHHWAVDLLQLGALLALESAFRSPRPGRWGAAAGALSALALFTLQDQGALLLAALGLFLFLPAWRRGRLPRGLFAGFSLGCAVVVAGVALWLLPRAGLGALWEQWCLFPLQNYKRLSGNQSEATSVLAYFEGLLRGGAFGRDPLFTSAFLIAQGFAALLLPAAVPPLLALLWRRGGEGFSPRLALLLCGCTAFLGTALRRYDIANLNWALPASLVLLAWALNLAVARGGWTRRLALGGASLLAAAALFTGLHFALVNCAPQKGGGVRAPAGTLRFLSAQRASEIQGVLSAVESFVPAGEPMFCYGYAPLLNYLAQRPNPTPYAFVISPQYHTAPHVARWTGALESKGVRWGVGLRYPELPGDPAAAYLRERFEVVWSNGAFVLWRRRG